jgi:hypothetical protein
VLRVEVHPGDQHNPTHAATGLWSLLAQLGRERWPRLLRGDAEWGNEGVMARAEQEGVSYLFRLRATANVKRALERAMTERDWSDAGQGWQGKETNLRLMGWSRQRRVVQRGPARVLSLPRDRLQQQRPTGDHLAVVIGVGQPFPSSSSPTTTMLKMLQAK